MNSLSGSTRQTHRWPLVAARRITCSNKYGGHRCQPWWGVLLAGLALLVDGQAWGANRPNVLLILADD
jgi:hypothetical protein